MQRISPWLQRALFALVSLCLIALVLLYSGFFQRAWRHLHPIEREIPERPLPVLMYHAVAPDGTECNEMTVTVGKLRRDIEWLYDHGYTPVLASDLLSPETLPEKPVLLTFDDGYENNYTLLYPLLQETGAKATIAIIVSMQDNPSDVFLTWDQCREMQASGLVELASHTYYRHNLDDRNGTFDPDRPNGIERAPDEDDEAFARRVLDDVQHSYERMVQETGVRPCCFAYPYGIKEPDAVETVERYFTVTFLTNADTADLAKGTLDLPRWTITDDTPVSHYLSYLN